MLRRGPCIALGIAIAACGAAERTPSGSGADALTITVLGTNDLHGRVRAAAVFGGYVENVRRARARDGGGVVVIDAGDLFQGTLESNVGEGAIVIKAYDAIGYAAAAIGNHEFDYGPVGEPAIAAQPHDDPRGALQARMIEASFPFLSANIVDEITGGPPRWRSFATRHVVEAAGIRIGIVGASTVETPESTSPANFRGLRIAPLAERIAAEARALRAAGVPIVIVTAHAGGNCARFDDPEDLSSCAPDEEIFRVARALPPGLVDVIVAGHTHEGVAHFVAGIAVIESFAHGRAFGRVDLRVDRATRRVLDVRIHPPQPMCRGEDDSIDRCDPAPYEGAPVRPSRRVVDAIAADLARADEIRRQPLNVEVAEPFAPSRHEESALGNFLADLMRAARPDADATFINGGALRASLPAGMLTYGDLYAAMPFDDRFATVRLTGADLKRVIARNLSGRHGILSLSGVRVRARCAGSEVAVEIERENGRAIRDDDPVVLVTSDFLATGGDGLISRQDLPEGAVELDHGPLLRDVLAVVLRNRGGRIGGNDRTVYDPARPRITYPAPRPVRCTPPQ